VPLDEPPTSILADDLALEARGNRPATNLRAEGAPHGRVAHADVDPVAPEKDVAGPTGSRAETFVAEGDDALRVERHGDEIRRLERRPQSLLGFPQRALDPFP